MWENLWFSRILDTVGNSIFFPFLIWEKKNRKWENARVVVAPPANGNAPYFARTYVMHFPRKGTIKVKRKKKFHLLLFLFFSYDDENRSATSKASLFLTACSGDSFFFLDGSSRRRDVKFMRQFSS